MTSRATTPFRRGFLLATLALAGIAIFLAYRSRAPRLSDSDAPQGAPMDSAGDAKPASKSAAPRHASQAAVAQARTPSEAPPPARFAFDALTQGRAPLRTEARMFQAQKWEPDLAKALDLPPGTPLQRRSAIYRIPELKFPLVRVDRIYRMDRPKGGANGAVAPSQIASEPLAPPSTAKAPGPVAPSAAASEPAGEFLWDNAMIADHLMVQAQPGVSREQLQRALPSSCRIQSSVNGDKGLYLVSIPHESERSLGLAVLALNHESLKKTIWFAEPDFLTGGADTTPDDPLFTTSTTDTTNQWGLAKIMAPRAWDVINQPISRQVTNGSGGTITLSATYMASSTVVAVVDTGVDYTHPDLIPNLYVNPGESGSGKETNGLDDDGNGRIDDYRGWNFVDGNNDPMDDVGHGTHVAGIIGAAGNNAAGGSGVCWGVKMLPVRIIKKVGSGTYGIYSDAVAAMDYLRSMNSPTKRIAVANHSWGGSGYSLAMLNAVNNPLLTADPLPDGVRGTYSNDTNVISVTGTATELNKIKIGMEFAGAGIPDQTVITIINGSTLTLSNYSQQRATNQPVCFANPIRPKPYGIVHVAAAGNSRFNSDRIPTYPASLPSGFMMSVGASDTADTPSVWSGGAGSNFGRLNVDIFAPGSSIWSTKRKAPGDTTYQYESRNGTSMAAPFVTATVALLKLWQPQITDLQARQIIIDNADVIPALKDKSMGGGRLNLAKVVDKLYQPMLVGSGGSTGGTGTQLDTLNANTALAGKAAVGRACYATRDGKVYAWGDNANNLLGVSGITESATPLEVPGLSNIAMVAANNVSATALTADGIVWTWGSATGTGRGVSSGILAPGAISSLDHVVAIAGFGSCTYAIKEDGTLWGWGGSINSPIGDGSQATVLAPVQVLADVAQVAPQTFYTVCAKRDGTVWFWGSRGHGVAGTGNTSGYQLTPIQVSGVTDVVGVAGSLRDVGALRGDGQVYRWGGLGGDYDPTPVILPGLSDIVSLSFGTTDSHHALAADGTVFAWTPFAGPDSLIGNGSRQATPAQKYSRVLTDGGRQYVQIYSGGWTENAAIALTADGELVMWGENSLGHLGQGRLGLKRLPVPCPGLGALVKIAEMNGGNNHCYGLRPDGSLCWWGNKGWAFVADNQIPETVPMVSGQAFSDIVTGWRAPNVGESAISRYFALAKRTNGTVIAWGVNDVGQFGSGSTSTSSTGTGPPVEVPALTGMVSIAASQTDWVYGVSGSFSALPHCLGVFPDGSVKAWGANERGQLGDGTTTERASPVAVPGLANVVQVACGNGFSLALTSSGAVYSWGWNVVGQLGIGTTTDALTPQIVSSLSDVVWIAAKDTAAFAVKSDGTAWSWGNRQLGRVVGVATTPGLIPSLAGVARIYPTTEGTYAVLDSGQVKAWGGNHLNAIAASLAVNTAGTSTPVPVIGLSNVVEITGSASSRHARLADGTIMGWGTGAGGCIGDGDMWFEKPVPILGLNVLSQSLGSLGAENNSDSWLIGNFSVSDLSNENVSADTADPDGDGITNLMEYALGLNPNENSRSGLPTPRLDAMTAQSSSEGAGGGTIQLFSVDDCCFATPVGLDAGKHYMAFTVERRGGIRADINYVIEVSDDLVTWRSGTPSILTVINTGELLEAYSTTAIEDQPRQFMRLKIQRK